MTIGDQIIEDQTIEEYIQRRKKFQRRQQTEGKSTKFQEDIKGNHQKKIGIRSSKEQPSLIIF